VQTSCSLVNGVPDGRIAPNDRGFTLGDGVFETIAVVAGTPCHWQTHLQRLVRGCERLGLPTPAARVLAEEARSAITDASDAGDADGVLRITLSRGPGGRGYARPAMLEPTRVVSFTALIDGLPTGRAVAVRTCDLRLALQPRLAGIKHLGRLEQILARAEWTDDGIAEGLMYDTDGFLVEATAANVFLVQDETLRTPRLDRCGVAGIRRSCVLAAAERIGLPVEIGRITAADLDRADEVFLTSSVAGIRRITCIDGRDCRSQWCWTERLAAVADALDTIEYRTE
jgi:4-amino-4-deoxychorismate lyase